MHASDEKALRIRHGEVCRIFDKKEPKKAQIPGLRLVDVHNGCRVFEVDGPSLWRVFSVLDEQSPFRAPAGDLSLAFVPLQKLRALHRHYLSDASATDVMTFGGDPRMSFAGEIVVAPAFALRQCRRYGNFFAAEVTLYLLHGYLHLSGLDDRTAPDREIMRRAEQVCMQLLRANEAILQCVWRGRSEKTAQGMRSLDD